MDWTHGSSDNHGWGAQPGANDDARRASDPGTPAAELARLAYSTPEVRPLIAANPSAYPGLLEWLGHLGDPDIDRALAARARPSPQPAPSQAADPTAAASPQPEARRAVLPPSGVPPDVTPPDVPAAPSAAPPSAAAPPPAVRSPSLAPPIAAPGVFPPGAPAAPSATSPSAAMAPPPGVRPAEAPPGAPLPATSPAAPAADTTVRPPGPPAGYSFPLETSSPPLVAPPAGYGAAPAAPGPRAPAPPAPGQRAISPFALPQPGIAPPTEVPGAPGTPSGTGGPKRHRARRWVIAAVATVVVAALVVAGVLLLPRTRTAAASAVPTVRAYPTAPSTGWRVSLSDLGLDTGSFAALSSLEYADNGDLLDAGSTWVLAVRDWDNTGVAGIDPATGALRWLSWQTVGHQLSACAPQLFKGTLLCAVDGYDSERQELLQIEPATGTQRAVWNTGAVTQTIGVDGDTAYIAGIGNDGSTMFVERMSGPDSVTWRQQWPLDRADDDAESVVGNRVDTYGGLVSVMIEGAAKVADANTGELLGSYPGAKIILWDGGRYVVGEDRDGQDHITVYHRGSTEPLWQADGYLASLNTPSGTLAYLVDDSGDVTAYNRATGAQAWKHNVDGYPNVMYVDDSRLIVESNRELVGLRAADGAQTWHTATGAELDFYPFDIRTDSTRIIGANANQLVAVSIADGTVDWRTPVPGAGEYIWVATAGPTLVVFDSNDRMTREDP